MTIALISYYLPYNAVHLFFKIYTLHIYTVCMYVNVLFLFVCSIVLIVQIKLWCFLIGYLEEFNVDDDQLVGDGSDHLIDYKGEKEREDNQDDVKRSIFSDSPLGSIGSMQTFFLGGFGLKKSAEKLLHMGQSIIHHSSYI